MSWVNCADSVRDQGLYVIKQKPLNEVMCRIKGRAMCCSQYELACQPDPPCTRSDMGLRLVNVLDTGKERTWLDESDMIKSLSAWGLRLGRVRFLEAEPPIPHTRRRPTIPSLWVRSDRGRRYSWTFYLREEASPKRIKAGLL